MQTKIQKAIWLVSDNICFLFYFIFFLSGIFFFWPLALLPVYIFLAYIIDYKILKKIYLNSQKWDLNICCGDTDGKGVNADIVEQKAPNFVLIKNIYELPFRDKQFKNILCSHTLEHVERPDDFYKELKRVSENVVLLVPPIWDIGAILAIRVHKWQFLTIKTKHKNHLPKRIKLPYSWYHKKIGQRICSY